MSYHIRLEPGGKSFEVESGQPILTAGLAAGLRMPYGCRMGTCRSCRGRVTSGILDFGAAHPAYLPQHQRDEGYALLCQASACSDLRVELEELPLLATPQISRAIIKKIIFPAPDVAVVGVRLPLHLNMQ